MPVIAYTTMPKIGPTMTPAPDRCRNCGAPYMGYTSCDYCGASFRPDDIEAENRERCASSYYAIADAHAAGLISMEEAHEALRRMMNPVFINTRSNGGHNG